jgi:AbiV family abortive infection protein
MAIIGSRTTGAAAGKSSRRIRRAKDHHPVPERRLTPLSQIVDARRRRSLKGHPTDMPKRRSLTLSNSTRLLNDARLLVDHRRFASAFALAVLGVEEIGKLLLDGWNADAPLAKPKASFHIQKQTAVASLLVGALAVRTYPEGSIVDPAGEKLKSLTKMFNESIEGRLFLLIRQQELDKRKQAALYQDDWLTSVADDFAEEHVNSIFKIASDARDAIDDKFIRRVGRAFYELTLAGGHQFAIQDRGAGDAVG